MQKYIFAYTEILAPFASQEISLCKALYMSA